MRKKAKARPKTKKATTCEKLKTRIQRTEQTILRRIQQVVEESCDKSRDLSDSDPMLLRTRNTSKKSSSRRDPAFSHANVLNEDTLRDNRCYCQHFLKIPRNLSRSFSNGTSTLERCNEELSFVQAIVWLKSAIVCASEIPVEQLQQIFDRQWGARGNRHCEDERTDVEQSISPVNYGLSVSDRTNLRDTFATSTPLNISNVHVYTPQRTVSYSRFENTQKNELSMPANDPTQSPVQSWTQWIHQSSNNCHITREKEKEVRSSIIPETDVESIVISDEDEEDFDMTYGIPEHQCFEFEEDVGCSVQRGSTSGIEQMNKKIIENEHIFQKNHTDVPSECKFTLPARSIQSINPIFDLENNFNGECFTSTRNQNYLADKALESDGSPKSLVITEKDMSQVSNVNPDKYFDILLDSSPDNSPALQMSNTVAENPNQDSAYSTSRYDIFNHDTAVETRSIAGNKRLSDTKYYSKLQPCKKKTITYETGKISSIDRMSTSSNSSLESFISAKDIFQISDDYNDEKLEFQIVNCDEQMNDVISGTLEDDAAVAAESIDDKCTPNIEHRYEPHPRNEKTITREKTTASASIIQGAVIPNTNIGHRYNLRPRNNRRISHEKEAPSPIIGKPEEYKSGRARNLLKKENENEDKMISADWLNFTLESLRIDRVITESTKVILSTLCDKKTMEEYVVKKDRQRNIYWKDSLEEEAVNTVLNISDIFTTEKKPNICIKVIMTAIVKTLNEIMRENQTCYTETSMWIYRVQIILEFCNSLPICVKVIDYLMTKLKSLQSVLTKTEGKIRKNTYVVINQLHLVFYALNIALGKYRTIIPTDQRSRPVEKIIPHVADLWKLQYIDKELEYTGLDLAAEKRWLNTLENSAVLFTKHYFVQFAEKSLSLVRRANLAI